MHTWSSSFTGFLIPNSFVATWSPEYNYLGGKITVLQCYVLPPQFRPAQDLFVSSTVFNKSLTEDRSTRLFTRISLDQYLAPNQIWSKLEISTQPQVGRQTQARWVFPPMIWCLGRCAHWKVANASSKQIQVIEWYVCIFTRRPIFLY